MFYYILYVVPKNLLSWIFGQVSRIQHPRFIVQLGMRVFAKRYQINFEEAERPLEEFKSLQDLFTRKLKPGIRPIGEGVVHPADSVLTEFGFIQNGSLIQAKGKIYSLRMFLGDDELFSRLQDGYFFTYYLCPTDYHRVHSPVDGEIIQVNHIPGRLWPVNPWSTSHIQNLFVVNERVVVTIKTKQGLCALTMVGATNVGKMTLAFEPDISTNSFWNRNPRKKDYTNPIPISRGDEVGVFHLGSTVIMAYEKSFFNSPHFQTGSVKMGGSLTK